MARLGKYVACAAVLILSTNVLAKEISVYQNGNDLYERCTATSGDKAGMYANCVGYITGVADTIREYQTSFGATARICIPDTAPPKQTTDVVIRWLQAHPAERLMSGSGIVYVALGEAWLCPK
jgi:hypothetical protein